MKSRKLGDRLYQVYCFLFLFFAFLLVNIAQNTYSELCKEQDSQNASICLQYIGTVSANSKAAKKANQDENSSNADGNNINDIRVQTRYHEVVNIFNLECTLCQFSEPFPSFFG